MEEIRRAPQKRSWRCRVGLHLWVKRTNDEGGRYLECSRCGKEDNIPDSAGPRIAI